MHDRHKRKRDLQQQCNKRYKSSNSLVLSGLLRVAPSTTPPPTPPPPPPPPKAVALGSFAYLRESRGCGLLPLLRGRDRCRHRATPARGSRGPHVGPGPRVRVERLHHLSLSGVLERMHEYVPAIIMSCHAVSSCHAMPYHHVMLSKPSTHHGIMATCHHAMKRNGYTRC